MDVVKKSPRYRSKYSEYVRRPDAYTKECGAAYKTMGKPEECVPNPEDYLRKGEGISLKSKCYHHSKDNYTFSKKPKCYATKEEIKEFNEKMKNKDVERQNQNFVALNIKKTVEKKPKIPEQKVAVSCKGDLRPLRREGDPIYIYSKHYGKTPPYLKYYIQNSHKEHRMKRDILDVEQPKCRYVTREEREKLLEGLKQNWEELQKQYQGLPILTDTIPKKIRKTKMEVDLKQLEKDIVLVERHPYIYVYNDQETIKK